MTCTAGTFTDDRDGKTYKTVGIRKLWMAENLNYEVEGSTCYDNSNSNCDIYGRLYNWEAAMKACPSGWHLPSKGEWGGIVDFVSGYIVGGNKVAGNRLKSKSGWNENGTGTDNFGFSALPGGHSDGSFDGVGYYGYWWSSSEYRGYDAYFRFMGYDGEHAGWYYDSKTSLFSVRCVQD